MANLNKKKGTRAESRVVKYLESRDILAKRKALSGSKDEGDIDLPGLGICLEVKTGKQTANYNRTQLDEWLRQTKEEGKNSSQPCYLVIVRYNRKIEDAEVFYQGGSNGAKVFRYLDEFCDMLYTPSNKRD